MKQLLEKVKTYDWGQSRATLTEITEGIKKAHGNKAEMAKIEKGLLGVLDSDAKRAAKQFACRQLSIIGTDASVATLGKMLTGEETSDMARYALERIPGRAAAGALLKALPKARGNAKIGIVNSLGQRAEPKASSAIAKLLDNSDETLAAAAAAALGEIADEIACAALAKASKTASGKLQLRVLDAYLKCADAMAKSGKKTKARAIYMSLQKKGLPKPIREAAVRGMAGVIGSKRTR